MADEAKVVSGAAGPDPAGKTGNNTIPNKTETVRLDRWLVAARMYKTRPVAQDHCRGGQVRVNGAPAGSDRGVKLGDTIDATTPGGQRVWKVLLLGVTRGPAAVAKGMYDDLTPPPPADVEAVAPRERGAGRPTKRDGREVRWLKGL